MLHNIPNEKYQDRIWSLLLTILFLSCYYVYFLLRIDPKLIYQSQESVFFFDRYFIGEFLGYPGGVNELVAGFLAQFFYYSWVGAALLVLVFACITWNTRWLIRSLRTSQPPLYLHWVPSILLLALHSNYNFPLILTLGLLVILLSVNIYIRLAPSNRALRLLFYIILQAMLYYVIAGQAFIFTMIIVLYEVLYCRRIVLPVLYATFSGLLPYAGASTVFIVHLPDAYTTHLMSYDKYKVTWLSWALYMFFPFVVVLVILERRYVRIAQKNANSFWDRFLYRRSVPARLLQGAFVFVLVVMAALFSYDRKAKAFLKVDYYARFGGWDKVLAMAQKGLPTSHIVQYQINRALYHSGYLSDKLFSVAQLFGGDGLFMQDNLRATFPLQHSDVFFDLGLINESEHWAYEAIVVNGETAWNLQRLALIYLLKGNQEVAGKYLAMLKKTVWHRSWAAEYQKYLSDSNDCLAHPQFQHLESAMPESNFLVSPTQPELCLEELLNTTKNKMAFEYFMAYCLLEGQIGRFTKHLHRLNDFDYQRIPRHFEEAMLVYNQIAGTRGIALPGKNISEETIRRFEDFNRIRTKYKGDKAAARGELLKHRDTYWFYGLYYYRPGEQ